MFRRFCLCIFVACLVGGCLVGPNYHQPETQVPEHWVGGSTTSQPASASTQPAPTSQPVDLSLWWDSLSDETLTSLIDRAIHDNLDLQLAEARIREARALRDVAVADFWPQVNLGSSYAYSRGSQNSVKQPAVHNGLRRQILQSALQQVRILPGGFNPATGAFSGPSASIAGTVLGSTANNAAAGAASAIGSSFNLAQLLPSNTGGISRDRNLYQLGFDATWEIDVFGRIRRSVEATDADLQSLIEAQRNVLITLISEVARNYIELRGSQRRLTIANENIQVQQESLDVSEQRYRGGFTNELDVAQARAQLERTRSEVPNFETAIRQSIFQLSVLLGTVPEALLAELTPQAPIPAIAPAVPLGLPSELLRRRPDIRQAERDVAAATARIGVATAELFPRLSLTGSFGTQSYDMKHFLDQRSLFWGVGPSIQWPLFTGGRLKANIRVEEARTAQAIAVYGQAVLVAFQDVESALVAYNNELVRHDRLVQAVEASLQATQLSRDLYTRGLGTFLNLLVSEASLYTAQDDLVLSDTALMTDLIALYKALGGGWESKEPAEVPTSQPSIMITLGNHSAVFPSIPIP